MEPWDECTKCTHAEIKWMGLSVRDERWRYTEWYAWNNMTDHPRWSSGTFAVELYDHLGDFGADLDAASATENLAVGPGAVAHASDIARLAAALKQQFQNDYQPPDEVPAPRPTRILFVGNSFTFVNDLPHQLVSIASSLGKTVVVDNSTIGGCTAFAQRAENDNRTAALLEKNEYDFIVLQTYSILPTVQQARATYYAPAVASFRAKKKSAKIVAYLTWGYRDGNDGTDCPSSGSEYCFPDGTNAELTSPPCAKSKDYERKVNSFECMGYAVARGYMDRLRAGAADGVDLVAPCGVAWQTTRGATPTPVACKAAIDAEYGAAAPSPFSAANNLTLPLRVDGLPANLKTFELCVRRV